MDDPTAPAPLSDLDETRRLLLETLGRSDLSEGSPVSELALASVATIAGEVVHLLNAYRSEIDTIARRVDPSADQAVSERVGEMIEDIIAHRAAGAGWRAAVQDAGRQLADAHAELELLRGRLADRERWLDEMTGERNIARAAAEGARGRMHAAESVAAAGRAALAIAVATAESLADSLECFHAADHSAAWTVPHLRRLVADYPEAVQAYADALELAWRTVDRAGASS